MKFVTAIATVCTLAVIVIAELRKTLVYMTPFINIYYCVLQPLSWKLHMGMIARDILQGEYRFVIVQAVLDISVLASRGSIIFSCYIDKTKCTFRDARWINFSCFTHQSIMNTKG